MFEPQHHLTSLFLVVIQYDEAKKKNQTVVRSSTKAKYRALANTASENEWFLALLQELSILTKLPPSLLYDNLGTTHLSFNPF